MTAFLLSPTLTFILMLCIFLMDVGMGMVSAMSALTWLPIYLTLPPYVKRNRRA